MMDQVMYRTVLLLSAIIWLSAGTPPRIFPEAGQTEMKESPDIAGIQRKWLDIRYATASNAQMLDIYLPNAGQGPFPVIVQIHGGAFFEGDKRDKQLSPVLPALDRGYAIVAVNYRLSGEAHFPAALQDVKAALRWVRAHATTYDLDAGRIATWGDSAGAHLAVLVAVSAGVRSLSDGRLGNLGVPDTIQAVVGWFGPYNFSLMDAQLKASGCGPAIHGGPRSAESIYLGAAVSEARDLAALANPATYLTPDDPAMLLQAGTKDAIVPVEQTIDLARQARMVLGPQKVTLRLLEGAAHADRSFQSQENLEFVLDWLDGVLKRP